ncbi:MAG: UDP-2,3-diacylglucosamine diphosphatase [Pseudomonadota bacterium]
MTTLFISDLHLSPLQPEIGHQLCAFLANEARHAASLYILGDLFEAWIGDDDPDPHYNLIQDALANYADANPGTSCYFMHGNRDFLVGSAFSERTGFEILSDPVVHSFGDQRWLLSHGDQYCTDDTEYMAVRATTRNPDWQQQVLSLPIDARRKMAGDARSESTASNAAKSMEIMDVNQQAVEQALNEAGVSCLLHGHTHRPAIHEFALPDGSPARRIVLGDWYTQGSVGVLDEHGFRLVDLAR